MTEDILDFNDSFILKKHKDTLKGAIHLRITTNPDYEISIDSQNRELRPNVVTKVAPFRSPATECKILGVQWNIP